MSPIFTPRKKILIPANVPGHDFSILEAEFELIRPAEAYRVFSDAEIDAVLPEISAFVSMVAVDKKRLAVARKLEVIAANGAGTDNVDVRAATERRIPVINIPETTSRATAEHAFALILAASRRVVELDRRMRIERDPAPLFDMGRNKGHDLFGRTLGIFGMGRIGRTLAGFARAFGMTILYHNRQPLPADETNGAEYVDFTELLTRSDIVSIHAPLNDQSRNRFNRQALAKMKPDAILINSGRGAIVDVDALADALENGRIAAAALDVFPNEPSVPEKLKALENIILTPHVGTNTHETRRAMADAIACVMRKMLREPADPSGLNLVNPEIYQVRSE